MGTYDKTKYGTDMRAIERWCNSLISGQDDVEIVLFQHSYTTTGCGPGLFSVFTASLGPLDAAGTTYAVTFDAPISGNVKVRASMFMEYETIDNTFPAGIVLCCVDQSTGAIRESPLELISSNQPSATRGDIIGGRFIYEGIVESLTPGTTYNWEIGGYYLPNTASTSCKLGISDGTSMSGPYGPLVVTVYAA